MEACFGENVLQYRVIIHSLHPSNILYLNFSLLVLMRVGWVSMSERPHPQATKQETLCCSGQVRHFVVANLICTPTPAYFIFIYFLFFLYFILSSPAS